MQHNEDLCVTDGSSSGLQGIDINKHMQHSDVRRSLYRAESLKAFLLLHGLIPT